jgi:hypothetical protein
LTSYLLIALFVACVGFGLDICGWWRARQERIAACSHRWEWRSVDNLDRGYERICIDCPKREPVKNEDVPYHERAKRKDYRP